MSSQQKKTKNTFRIATYNIQASNRPGLIIHNIKHLIEEGIVVFCLQELRYIKGKAFIGDILRKSLGQNWKVHFFFCDEMKGKDLGICMIWNTDVVQLKDIEEILLPQLIKKSILERLEERFMGAHRVLLRRKALVATYIFAKKTIRISNIHLDWQGGWKQRKIQLQVLKTHIQKQPVRDFDIVCGDFNTTKWPFPADEESAIASLFGEQFTNVSESISYTSDLNSFSFYDWLNTIFNTVIRLLRIHCYQKVDHIWSRGLTPTHITMEKLSGSDHFPVISTFVL